MQQYRSIHYLRGLAAIMVCIFHIFANTKFLLDDIYGVWWMQGGVDIFFVISGFVMVSSTSGRAVSPGRFLTQRIQRIVPLYWFATLVVMLQIPGQWGLKIQSLLFIPAMNPKVGMIQPILEPGWTLNYEMFFYLAFACSLFLKEAYRFLAIASLFLGLWLWGVMMQNGDLVGFYSRPIVMEFVLGMAIAKFGLRLPRLAVPIGLLAMFALQSTGFDRVLIFGLPAALIVAGALSAEDRLPKWQLANLMGSASYSIYLFHLLVLGAVISLWPYGGEGKPMFVGIALGFMLLAGCGIYWALERPLIAFFASLRSKHGTRSKNAEAMLPAASLGPPKPHSQS